MPAGTEKTLHDNTMPGTIILLCNRLLHSLPDSDTVHTPLLGCLLLPSLPNSNTLALGPKATH